MYNQNPYSQYPYLGYSYPNYGNRQFVQPQQQMAQPQPQVQQQPMQYEMPIQDIRFVTSEEAKAFIVMPNRNALLIDKPNGTAFFKYADGMGQSATQYFKFEQVNPDGSSIKTQESTPKIDYGEFVTKKEFDNVVTQYNLLLNQVNDMKKMISSLNAPKTAERVITKANTQPTA